MHWGRSLLFPGKNRFNATNQPVDFLPGGLPAEGNPDGAVDNFRGQMHGGEHMAPVPLGTGRACTDANPRLLQNVDGVLGRHTGDGDTEDVGRLMGAVDDHPIQGRELSNEGVKQGLFRWVSTGKVLPTAADAAAKPAMAGVASVPLRYPFSCPPPSIMGGKDLSRGLI